MQPMTNKHTVYFVQKYLDELAEKDEVLFRASSEKRWSVYSTAEKWKAKLVNPMLDEVICRVLGDLNVDTDIVIFRYPQGGYTIRMYEIECQLETLHNVPEATAYIMERMVMVDNARLACEAALKRRLTTPEALMALYGGLRLTRGAEVSAELREAVENLTIRVAEELKREVEAEQEAA